MFRLPVGSRRAYSRAVTDRPIGVLLLQLGTPDSPKTSDVRTYLREFLSDPRVLDMPAAARHLLLNGVILPLRPGRSAHAYRQIWTDEGSPLIIHTERLARKVGRRLGDGYRVAYGMRYQSPSIASAIAKLTGAGCDRLIVFPLFPQYASASGGSAVAKTLAVVADRWNVLDVSTIGPFYDNPGFLHAVAAAARPALDEFRPDHVVFSYHGLPAKQIRKSDPTGQWCLANQDCCEAINEANRFCYRAHSFATTRGLVAELGIEEGSYHTTFQSRLTGQKWIKPYTDKVLPQLYAGGVRRLAVLTPSFAADCLETLEEIGIRGRNQWMELGGEELLLLPCVNDSDLWATAVANLIRGRAGVRSDPEHARP